MTFDHCTVIRIMVQTLSGYYIKLVAERFSKAENAE